MSPELVTRISTSRLQAGNLDVPLPAPLLLTRKAQLPSLPHPLATTAIPPNTVVLLQLPISDWHVLNPHAKLTAASLLSELSLSISEFSAIQHAFPAITVLSTRAASSRQAITSTPGSAMGIAMPHAAGTGVCKVKEVVEMHRVMQTNFVIAPSDHLPLCTTPSSNALRKRAKREQALLNEFQSCDAPTEESFIPIGGAHSEQLRKEVTKYALSAFPSARGFVIEGLFAGESPIVREQCIRAVTELIPKDKIVILSGSSGSPEDVILAVSCGVHAIPSDYPFEMAGSGYAFHIYTAKSVNVRDRKWEVYKGPLIDNCKCYVCLNYSRAYIRHLWETHEMMGYCLVAMHNLWEYYKWFETVRNAVRSGDAWERFVTEFEQTRDKVQVGETE